jgi:hypothetical protein
MKQKIHTSDLKIGMYVSELDRPWTSTRFLFQGFEIRDDEILQEVKNACEYVYIDLEKGPALKESAKPKPASPRSTSRVVIDDDFNPDLSYVLKGPPTKKRWQPEEATLEEELPVAKRIESETRNVLYNTLEDVRLGKTIDSDATKAVIADMVESIIRNPDAMGVLSQLKDSDEYTALHSVRV